MFASDLVSGFHIGNISKGEGGMQSRVYQSKGGAKKLDGASLKYHSRLLDSPLNWVKLLSDPIKRIRLYIEKSYNL